MQRRGKVRVELVHDHRGGRWRGLSADIERQAMLCTHILNILEVQAGNGLLRAQISHKLPTAKQGPMVVR